MEPRPDFSADASNMGRIREENTMKTTLLGREPVMFLALVQTALALGVGFGIDLTPEQIGLVLAFSAAVLGFLARSQVSPVEG